MELLRIIARDRNIMMFINNFRFTAEFDDIIENTFVFTNVLEDKHYYCKN